MKQKIVLDIVMLSNFGKQDGGRETWLYNFLPELLKNDHISKVHLFGFRTQGQPDNSELLKKLDIKGEDRIVPVIVEAAPTRYPKFISMFRLLRQTFKNNTYVAPTHAMAVGGMLETVMLRFIGRFQEATRIVWLRSIFTQEKAYRIPSPTMSLVRGFEKRNLKKASDIYIVNGDDTQNFYSQYDLPINTIKNAINVAKWEMPSMQPAQVMHVAYIGRLSKVKGIESYFDLARSIKKSNIASNFVFHVVGEANIYREEVIKLNEDGVLLYHGAMSNDKLPGFLRQIHICVALTFVSEKLGGAGLSNALIEQMAAEKIIVAWNNNAFNQILDESSAFQVTQYSVEGLVEALKNIYNDQDKALIKASIAKEIVKPYTIEAHVEKFLKVLEGYESVK